MVDEKKVEKKEVKPNLIVIGDRRYLINLLRYIEAKETLIEASKQFIREREIQLKSEIKEKDQWNNKKTKNQLESEIKMQKDKLKDDMVDLQFKKEDLVNYLRKQDLRKAKAILEENAKLVEKGYERIKKYFR
jgi:hypothetical protein